ncbi:MAG: hypothetical protein Q4Q58_03025 [Thermoplasmata archaeon]|nr:hypothetical protein [Thermoplasmata archaeon]
MAGISNRTIAVIAVVVIVIAAAAAYVVMNDRDDSKDTVSLSVCDTFRYGDTVAVTTASGLFYEYVVTEVLDDSYVVSVSMSLDGSSTYIFAGTLDRATLVSEFVMSDTSEYTEVGTVQIESVYGWVDATQYSMTTTIEGVELTTVYDVETASGILIGYTQTVGDVSTVFSVESTMVDVDGSHRDVQTIETTGLSYTEGYEVGMEYGVNSTYLSLDSEWSTYFYYSSEITAVADSGYTVVSQVYDETWTPTTVTSVYSADKLDSMLRVIDGVWDDYTVAYSGTATIITEYGYVESAKYTFDWDGVTACLYAEPDSGSVLMIICDEVYSGVQCMHCYSCTSANLY